MFSQLQMVNSISSSRDLIECSKLRLWLSGLAIFREEGTFSQFILYNKTYQIANLGRGYFRAQTRHLGFQLGLGGGSAHIQYLFLIMEVKSSSRETTLRSTNYFGKDKYLGKFKQQWSLAGVANILTTTLLAPLERWRVIAQTQSVYLQKPSKFRGFLDFVTRAPKEQGWLSLWRGNYSSFWIYIYQTFFQIALYDSIKEINKDMVKEFGEDDGMIIGFMNNIFFPFYTSLVTTAIIHPVDTYRIQRTMSYHKGERNAQISKFRLRRQEIGRNLFSGYWLANIIALINFNFYKQMYTLGKDIDLSAELKDLRVLEAGLSVLAVGLVHPLDTLKKMLQLNNQHSPTIFMGYRSLLSHVKQHGAYMSLYNGFTASVCKAALFAPLYVQIFRLWGGFLHQGNPSLDV